MSEALETLRSLLAEDGNQPFPRFPPVAEHLLKDARLMEMIERRLEAKMQVVNVLSLGYDFHTGIQSTYFEFAGDASPLGNGSRAPSALRS